MLPPITSVSMVVLREEYYGVYKKVPKKPTQIRLNGMNVFPFEGEGLNLGGLPPPDRHGARNAAAAAALSRLNGVNVSPFEGEGNVWAPPLPEGPDTRSGGRGKTAQLFHDKGVQTLVRAPGSITLWERERRLQLAKPKQQVVFVGGAYRIDGGKVDPKLKNRDPKQRKPKRQFSKKKKAPSSPRPPAVRRELPVPRVADTVVQKALSIRGRLIRKTARFDPSTPQSTIKSVSRRRKDGMYVVSMLMTEEEVMQKGGWRFLRK